MRFGSQKQEEAKEGVSLDLAIDLQRLNDEIMDQPLLYKRYAELDAESQAAVRAAESYTEQVESMAHLNYSQLHVKAKVKDIEARVHLDPKVIEAKQNLNALKEQADKIRGAVKAAHQRHDALKDLAANRRKELID